MKNWEALKALSEGKCVRHESWRKGGRDTPLSIRLDGWKLLSLNDGWEIYEPEEQGHDWRWACEQMVDGRRVRRKMWDWGYIPYDDTNGMILHRHDFDATDWILYSEPEVPHDWAWACEQLLAGKKVRRKSWITGHWYQLKFELGIKPNGGYRELYEPGPDCAGLRATVSEADFKATDWVLADEGVKP